MFARIGSRHFAHLYISGLPRFRLGLLLGLRDFTLERGCHDRAVGASREDVPASAALPDAGRLPADGDGRTPGALVSELETSLDLLHAAANPDSIAGPEPADTACLLRATSHEEPHQV